MKPTLMPSSTGYWEPRFGLSWQPGFLTHTVFHAGFGLFSGPLQYSSYNHSADIAPFAPLYDFKGTSCAGGCSAGAGTPVSGWLDFSHPWLSANSPGPDPFASGDNWAVTIHPSAASTFPTGPNAITVGQAFARDFKLGITQSWNVSVEQQLTTNMMVRLAYVGSQSYHQSVAIDQNAATANIRPYNRFGPILTNFSNATASYNSLQASFDRRMSRNLQVQSSFTWSKTIDAANSSNVSFGTPYLGDPFNMKWNRGNSSLSVPWNSVTNFILEGPRFAGQSRLLRQTLGGWELSSIITFQTGNPFSIGSAGSNWDNNNSGSLQGGDRADLVPGQPLNAGKGNHWDWVNKNKGYFNQAAFTNAAPGTFGSSGKNMMFGPRVFTTDAGIMKTWALTEGTRLQFRWEAFNATNHPSFASPAAPWGSVTGWAGVVGNQWNANNNIVQTGQHSRARDAGSTETYLLEQGGPPSEQSGP